jgi:cephalosporin hydroxylase
LAVPLNSKLMIPAQWSPVHGAAARLDDHGLLVLGDGPTLDYHLLRLWDARLDGVRIKVTMVARPVEGCDTNLYIHHWGGRDVCSIASNGEIVLNEEAEDIVIERRADGFLSIAVIFLNRHPTLSVGLGRPRGLYHGSGREQYVFESIAVELLPINAVRQAIIDRLWQGRDPIDNFPHDMFEYDLQGWNSEHCYLSDSIALLRPSVIVEIGVWKGGSIVFMANQLKKHGLSSALIAVDTWLGSSEHWLENDRVPLLGYSSQYYKFLSNVVRAKVADYVVPLPLDSLNAAQVLTHFGIRPSLIHLDAAHDYDSVVSDLRAWWPLLTPNGVLVGDDYDPDGAWVTVRRGFDDFFRRLGLTPIEHTASKCRVFKPG